MNHKIFIWLKAARLPSQSYILFPILLGQTIAYSQMNVFNWENFYLLLGFSLFIQLFIIFANDYADQETDSLNQTYTIFSGGSRVLADGKLSSSQIKTAAIICLILCLVIGFLLTFMSHRPFAMLFVLGSFLLLWMYSYKPIQLSYRGGGELLQMVGLGFILPLFAYYIQSNSILTFPCILIWIILPTHLACAIATSLPDQPSDQISHKKTFTVRMGGKFSKITIFILQFISLILIWNFISLSDQNTDYTIWTIIPFLTILFSFLFFSAKPGDVKLSVFVFLCLFTTMAIECLLIMSYYENLN